MNRAVKLGPLVLSTTRGAQAAPRVDRCWGHGETGDRILHLIPRPARSFAYRGYCFRVTRYRTAATPDLFWRTSTRFPLLFVVGWTGPWPRWLRLPRRRRLRHWIVPGTWIEGEVVTIGGTPSDAAATLQPASQPKPRPDDGRYNA